MNEVVKDTGKETAVGSSNRIRYYYFGRRLFPIHKGVVTAGAMVIPKTDAMPEMLRVAFAYCSPTDVFRRRSSGIEHRRKYTHANGTTLSESVEVVIYGGLDIVNSRLGLCPIKDYPEQSYDIPRMSNSVIEDVMAVFNGVVPVAHKPQLWAKRQLVLAPRGMQIISFCKHYNLSMNLDWRLMEALEEKIPGFKYMGAFQIVGETGFMMVSDLLRQPASKCLWCENFQVPAQV